jgi:1,4-dihydroxy-2-naphthoate octaprenyltransferase
MTSTALDMNQDQKLKSLILAFRPKTLTAAVVPCLAGTALAADLQKANWIYLLWAVASAIFIQIGTNLVNDAIDFKKGADTDKRIGPQRITQSGVFSFKQVIFFATLSFLFALLCGIPLVLQGGVSILVIGLVSILLGYGYTAGPYPLAYKGLGDLFVILFFGVIAVMGMSYIHTMMWSLDALVLGLQIGMLAAVLIAINNLRDHEGDRLVGKKTMAVRLGVKWAKREILFLIWTPFILGFYWLFNSQMKVFLIVIPLTFLAGKLSVEIIKNAPSPYYNQLLAKSAGLHFLFGLLVSVGFIL